MNSNSFGKFIVCFISYCIFYFSYCCAFMISFFYNFLVSIFFELYGLINVIPAKWSLYGRPHAPQIRFIYYTSCRNIDFQNVAYYVRNLSEMSMQRPKSRITTWCFFGFEGSGRTKMLPGWGSQWINPDMKICYAKPLMMSVIMAFLSNPYFFNCSSSVTLIPSIHSETITLFLVNSSII